MSDHDNFIDAFQKNHSDLSKLIDTFKDAIEASNRDKAKELISKIEDLTNSHFSFEETYLYPRLRRLVLEITANLLRQQQTMKEFINQSRIVLEKNKLNKNEVITILDTIPKLSKFFKDCNELVSLAEKFNKEDKDDLNRRFKECSQTKNMINA